MAGVAYTFILTTTQPSHPLYLTSGTGAGSPTISAGVVGSQSITNAGQSFVFTPASNLAGTTINYMCTVHPNLGGSITGERLFVLR